MSFSKSMDPPVEVPDDPSKTTFRVLPLVDLITRTLAILVTAISSSVKVSPLKSKKNSKLGRVESGKVPSPGSPSKLNVPVPTIGGVTVESGVVSNLKSKVNASDFKGLAIMPTVAANRLSNIFVFFCNSWGFQKN